MIGLDVEQLKGSNSTEQVVNTTHDFSKAQNFTVIYSLPSKPDAINISSKLCNNSVQIEDLYDDTRGLKMMFAQGQLFKTNILLQDNEFEYYRLIGEAYNKNILARANVSQNSSPPGTNFFTYMINGLPQTQAHSSESDLKYGYSKQVLVGKDHKLFSSSCDKLKYNASKQRLSECRLATGYFIVNQLGLYKHIDDNFIFK